MAGRTGAFGFVLALLVGGASLAAEPQQSQTPPVPQATPAVPNVGKLDARSYAVGAGDTLKITIFGEGQLPTEFTIGADGKINFPYLNEVPVADLTLREIEADLEKRLMQGKFYEAPQVTVEITNYRSQNVLMQGQVGRQGQLTLTGNDMTLIRALATAGYTALAGDDIEVRRPKAGASANPVTGVPDLEILKFKRRELDLNNALDIPLRNGDIVWVSKAQTFFIEGFVRQTGSLTWDDKMTVGRAIMMAGGLTERGTRKGLKINRQVDEKTGRPCSNVPDVIGEAAAPGCVYKRINANENTRVLPGDSVVVPQKRF